MTAPTIDRCSDCPHPRHAGRCFETYGVGRAIAQCPCTYREKAVRR